MTGYGLTETSPILAFNRPGAVRAGTVGQALRGVTLRIANADATGGGEIEAQGASVFAGYRGDDAASARAFTADRWFRTGDFGRLDRDRFLSIVARVAETIVLADGKKLFPETVEAVYAEQPLVKEIALLAVDGALVGAGRAGSSMRCARRARCGLQGPHPRRARRTRAHAAEPCPAQRLRGHARPPAAHPARQAPPPSPAGALYARARGSRPGRAGGIDGGGQGADRRADRRRDLELAQGAPLPGGVLDSRHEPATRISASNRWAGSISRWHIAARSRRQPAPSARSPASSRCARFRARGGGRPAPGRARRASIRSAARAVCWRRAGARRSSLLRLVAEGLACAGHARALRPARYRGAREPAGRAGRFSSVPITKAFSIRLAPGGRALPGTGVVRAHTYWAGWTPAFSTRPARPLSAAGSARVMQVVPVDPNHAPRAGQPGRSRSGLRC